MAAAAVVGESLTCAFGGGWAARQKNSAAALRISALLLLPDLTLLGLTSTRRGDSGGSAAAVRGLGKSERGGGDTAPQSAPAAASAAVGATPAAGSNAPLGPSELPSPAAAHGSTPPFAESGGGAAAAAAAEGRAP